LIFLGQHGDFFKVENDLINRSARFGGRRCADSFVSAERLPNFCAARNFDETISEATKFCKPKSARFPTCAVRKVIKDYWRDSFSGRILLSCLNINQLLKHILL
jgi:hypothetical protein